MALPEVVLYSKPACCLCEKAREQLVRLQEQHEFALREINILENSKAYKTFKNEIPVIFINGKKAFRYRLDEKDFVELLMEENCQQHGRNNSAQ